jgi:hypothetical protein
MLQHLLDTVLDAVVSLCNGVWGSEYESNFHHIDKNHTLCWQQANPSLALRKEKVVGRVTLGSRRNHLSPLHHVRSGIDGLSPPLLAAPKEGGGGDLGPTLGTVLRSLKL